MKMAGITDISVKAGWMLRELDLPTAKEERAKLIDFWHPSGIIVDCSTWREKIGPDDFPGVPAVFLDADSSLLARNATAVSHDSEATGAEAARVLMTSGRNDFAYVPYPDRVHWCAQRKAGFIAALELNGAACTVFETDETSPQSVAYQQDLRKFLAALPRPCGVFAANDSVAENVIAAATAAGLKVPDEISVVGVDNAESVCERTNPTLTSIEPDFRRGGRIAALLLLTMMREGPRFRLSRARAFGPFRTVSRGSTFSPYANDPSVTAALEMIRAESCNGLTVSRVLKTFGCSRQYASARFRKATGHTVLEEINRVRMEQIKVMLGNPNQQLKSISDFCGFKSPNSLRKFFRRETGLTMSAWRKRQVTS